MQAYVVLTSLTEQGLQHVKQIPGEIEAAKKLAPRYGVLIDAYFMLTGGDYDFLAQVRAPDDKAITEFVLAAGMAGYSKPAIMHSFTADDIKDIFSKV